MFDENQIRAWKRTYWLDTFRLLTPRVLWGRPVVSAKTCVESIYRRGEKTLQTCAHFASDREPPLHGRDLKRSLLHFPINNNKLPVSATGKTKSLDLFQRKHDKQAIQRLKRVRKDTKTVWSPFAAPGWSKHNGKPVFNLFHTCARNLHVRAVLIRVFISALVHLKGFKWSVNIRYVACKCKIHCLKNGALSAPESLTRTWKTFNIFACNEWKSLNKRKSRRLGEHLRAKIKQKSCKISNVVVSKSRFKFKNTFGR